MRKEQASEKNVNVKIVKKMSKRIQALLKNICLTNNRSLGGQNFYFVIEYHANERDDVCHRQK